MKIATDNEQFVHLLAQHYQHCWFQEFFRFFLLDLWQIWLLSLLWFCFQGHGFQSYFLEDLTAGVFFIPSEVVNCFMVFILWEQHGILYLLPRKFWFFKNCSIGTHVFLGSCSHGSLRVWFIISFLLPDERRLEISVLSNPSQLSNFLDAICGLKNVLGIPIRHFLLSNCKFTCYPHTRPYFLQLKECCIMLMVHGIVWVHCKIWPSAFLDGVDCGAIRQGVPASWSSLVCS